MNRIGYQLQHFLTLFSGEQGKEWDDRGFHHKWSFQKWSVRMEAASGMSLLKSSAHPSGKAFSLETG